MTGRASLGAPAAPSSGTSAKARICEFFGIITMRKEKTTNGLKFSQLCIFFFSSLNHLACVQGVPCKRPGAFQAGEQLPIAFGAHGDRRCLWVGSSLVPQMRHCACAWGELLFRAGWRGGGSADTHQGGLPTHLHPCSRSDYKHSIYTHTHLPVVRKSVPLFRFLSQGSIMGRTPPMPLQKD